MFFSIYSTTIFYFYFSPERIFFAGLLLLSTSFAPFAPFRSLLSFSFCLKKATLFPLQSNHFSRESVCVACISNASDAYFCYTFIAIVFNYFENVINILNIVANIKLDSLKFKH